MAQAALTRPSGKVTHFLCNSEMAFCLLPEKAGPARKAPASSRKASDIEEWVMCSSRERSLRGHPQCANGYFVLPGCQGRLCSTAFSSFPYFLRLSLIKHSFFFLYVSQAPSFPSFSSSHFLLPSPSEGRPEKVGPSSSVPVNTSAFLLNVRFQFPGCMQATRPFRPEGLKCQDQSCMENPFFLRATLPASCSRSAPAWLTCGKPLSEIMEWIILEISNFVSLK